MGGSREMSELLLREWRRMGEHKGGGITGGREVLMAVGQMPESSSQ